MRRLSLLGAAVAGVMMLLSSVAAKADLSEILKTGVVKIGVPESFAPFGSLGASGELEGYDIDVAKLVAKDLGVKLELVPIVSKQRIPFLETGRVDLVISTLGANPERAKSIWYSSSYAPFYTAAFAAKGKKIASIADLSGMKVGLTGGTIEDIQFTESVPEGTEIRRFGDNAATQSAFVAEQVDVMVTSIVVAAAVAKANPGIDMETKFISKKGASFIGLKKGNIDLLQWINVFIMHKKLRGKLNELSLKWMGQPLPPLPHL
ncbi:MAG: amino acid ABC transporter substrate-binding protein [Hyphomicrobiaceae bacterium TMED74]|nr:amino acid ABC transporter substrate-binding protein [Filomicrobium sp.]RPG48509.1 MAG: amino acid ABC transporter substrate-binding protein [Hyphomicrobiaceae bacterium TMED74]